MSIGRSRASSKNRKFAERSRLYVACALTLLVFLTSLGSVAAPELQPPWIDFAISSLGPTPSVPVVGDRVIFGAEVQIVNSNMVLLQWVDVRCSVDDHTWHEETIVVGESPSRIYALTPWNATLGSHVVTWEVDLHFDYPESNRDNNAVSERFTVGRSNGDFDFSITVAPNWSAVKPNDSTSFQLSLYTRENKGTLKVSVDGAPSGLAYSIAPPQLNSSGSSRLDIHCGSVTVGLYHLTLTASGYAVSHSVTLTLIVEPLIKKGSTITISVVSTSVMLGENVTIQGVISPSQSTPITLQYTRPEGLTFSVNLRSDSNGAFAYRYEPDTAGQWKFSVGWPGDLIYLGSQSAQIPVQVNVTPPSPAEGLVKQLQAKELDVLNAVGAILIVILVVMLLYAFILVSMQKRT